MMAQRRDVHPRGSDSIEHGCVERRRDRAAIDDHDGPLACDIGSVVGAVAFTVAFR